MATNYRRIYEKHLGIILPKEIHVHHMDHNRQNNCIKNLVAIPNKLHGDYHGAHKNYFELKHSYGKIRKPTSEELSVFNFSNIYNGHWKTVFGGTLEEFMIATQVVRSRQNILAMINSERKKYLTYAFQIRSLKRQQSKRI